MALLAYELEKCFRTWNNCSVSKCILGGLVAQSVKNLPAMQGTQVRFLGWEDPLAGFQTHLAAGDRPRSLLGGPLHGLAVYGCGQGGLTGSARRELYRPEQRASHFLPAQLRVPEPLTAIRYSGFACFSSVE